MERVNLKTEIFIGKDSLDILKEIKNSNVLIISDSFLVKNHAVNRITEKLSKSNKVKIFDHVEPDPPLNSVSETIKNILEINATYIIGFGGGSAIDTAKGAIYFLKESGKLTKDIKFIAIPTTSGTGSEVTSFAVISDREKHIKHALISDDLLPNATILDVEFTKTVPKSVVANTGMDVLTHILESYVAKGSNDYSEALAEKSGELLVKYLYRSYSNSEDSKAREKVHIASNMAGMSFNIAGLGINHSIAHQIGGMYHVAHGLANSILLTSVIDYNSREPKVKEKYSEFTKKIGLVECSVSVDFAVNVLKEFIRILMKLMEMPSKLKDCKVEKTLFMKDLEVLALNAMKDNCFVANPTSIDKNGIINILKSIYE